MKSANKGRGVVFVFTSLCVALFLCFALFLSSCSNDLLAPLGIGSNDFSISNKAQAKDLRDALEILHSPRLKKSGYYPVQRMLAARRISTILIEDGQQARAARFLSSLAEEHDAYEAWYLFAAGRGCCE